MFQLLGKARRGRRRVFFGWWIVAGAWALQGLNGGLFFQAFGAYFVHFQADFGWTRAQVAGAFSLSRAESGLLGPFQGWLIQRFGTRVLIRIGTVIFALGFFALSWVDNLTQFYGAYLIISLGSSIGGFITINAALANWFDKKRTMAMGLASTGWGTAGLLVPVVALALGAFGWRETAFWSGIIVLVIGLPLAQLFRYAPEPYGYLPDGEKPAGERQDDGLPATSRPILALVAKGFTARQALKAPSFWYISLGHATAMLAVSAINALLIPYLTESMGISVFQAALVVMLLTVIMVAGQATIGFLGDRFEKRKIIVACMVGHTVALLILAFAQTLPVVVLFAVIHGIAWGFRGPLMTAIRADYFGRGSFATIMGFSSLIIQMGTMIGPLFGAFVADVTGSFGPAFGVIALFTAAGAFLFNAARKPEMPETPVAPDDPQSQSASAAAC